MGRRALPPLLLTLLPLLLVPLACREGSSDCHAKTSLIAWSCTNDTTYTVDEKVKPFDSCVDLPEAMLTIDPSSDTHWKVVYTSSNTAEINVTLREVNLTVPSILLPSVYERPERVAKMEFDTTGINLTNLHLQIESENGTVSAFPNGTLDRVWSSVASKFENCSLNDAISTSSSTSSSTTVSASDATTVEEATTAAALLAKSATKEDSAVALPTYLATTSALGVVVIILLVVVIVLAVKLSRARRRASLNCFNMPTPSSSVVSSTHLELDRNSQKKQTWENFKSKERRRSAMLKPEPDTETGTGAGTGAGKQEPPSEPASQKPAPPLLKNGRPKFMKTKTMTMDFD